MSTEYHSPMSEKNIYMSIIPVDFLYDVIHFYLLFMPASSKGILSR